MNVVPIFPSALLNSSVVQYSFLNPSSPVIDSRVQASQFFGGDWSLFQNSWGQQALPRTFLRFSLSSKDQPDPSKQNKPSEPGLGGDPVQDPGVDRRGGRSNPVRHSIYQGGGSSGGSGDFGGGANGNDPI